VQEDHFPRKKPQSQGAASNLSVHTNALDSIGTYDSDSTSDLQHSANQHITEDHSARYYTASTDHTDTTRTNTADSLYRTDTADTVLDDDGFHTYQEPNDDNDDTAGVDGDVPFDAMASVDDVATEAAAQGWGDEDEGDRYVLYLFFTCVDVIQKSSAV